eukprot:gene15529-18447_t
MGFIRLEEEVESLSRSKRPIGSLTSVKLNDVVLVNHTSYIDVIYLTYKYSPTFAVPPNDKEGSNEGRLVPLTLGRAIMNAIYSPLQLTSDSMPTSDLMAMISSTWCGPLVVFPEGTTGNGLGLLEPSAVFTQPELIIVDAFHVLGITYPTIGSNVSPTFTVGSLPLHLVRLCATWRNIMTVRYLSRNCMPPIPLDGSTHGHLTASDATEWFDAVFKALSSMIGVRRTKITAHNKLSFVAYWRGYKDELIFQPARASLDLSNVLSTSAANANNSISSSASSSPQSFNDSPIRSTLLTHSSTPLSPSLVSTSVSNSTSISPLNPDFINATSGISTSTSGSALPIITLRDSTASTSSAINSSTGIQASPTLSRKEQEPLKIGDGERDQVVKVIINPATPQDRSIASKIFIKILLDIYCKRGAEGEKAIMVYLMQILESTHRDARIHLFNIILNLSIHVNIYSELKLEDGSQGIIGELQDSVFSLLRQILDHCVQHERDEKVWLEALNCTLFFIVDQGIVARPRLLQLNSRIIASFLFEAKNNLFVIIFDFVLQSALKNQTIVDTQLTQEAPLLLELFNRADAPHYFVQIFKCIPEKDFVSDFFLFTSSDNSKHESSYSYEDLIIKFSMRIHEHALRYQKVDQNCEKYILDLQDNPEKSSQLLQEWLFNENDEYLRTNGAIMIDKEVISPINSYPLNIFAQLASHSNSSVRRNYITITERLLLMSKYKLKSGDSKTNEIFEMFNELVMRLVLAGEKDEQNLLMVSDILFDMIYTRSGTKSLYMRDTLLDTNYSLFLNNQFVISTSLLKLINITILQYLFATLSTIERYDEPRLVLLHLLILRCQDPEDLAKQSLEY